MLLSGYSQTQQQLSGACFSGVPVQFRKMCLEVRRAYVIFLARIGIGVDGVPFVLRFPELCMPHQHDVEHALILVFELVLAKFSQSLALVYGHVAIGSLEVAAEDFHERGLAATVRADQAVAVAIAEFDRNVFKERLGAELDCKICCGKHGVGTDVGMRVCEARCNGA